MDSIQELEHSIVHDNVQLSGKDNLDTFNQSKEIMAILQEHLVNYDTEATTVFDQLKELPVATKYQTQFKKIQTSINNYDFEKALQQVKEIDDVFCE